MRTPPRPSWSASVSPPPCPRSGCPPWSGWSRAERCSTFFRASAGGQVVLLCAPAGQRQDGAAAVVGASPGPRAIRVAWVSVERDEEDAQHFWLSVDRCAGRRGARGGAGRARQRDAGLPRGRRDRAAAVQPRRARGAGRAGRSTTSTSCARPTRCGCSSASSPGCRRRCAWCCRRERIPGSGSIACASPGDLVEIRGADLRFSLEETRGLLEADGIALGGRGGGATARAHGRLGGRPAAGGDLARGPSGPRALRQRVLRQRADRGGVPPGRGARAPAGRGSRPAAADVDPGPRQRSAGRLPDRRPRAPSGSCRSSRTRTRSCRRSTPAGRGSATTTCSPTCSGSSCAGSLRRPSGRCTAPPPSGTRSTGTWSRPSAMRRRPATGRTRRAWSPTTTSASSSTAASRRSDALLAAFPKDAADTDPELALAFAKARLYDGLLEESAHHLAMAEQPAPDACPPSAGERFELQLAETRLALARRRGDLRHRARVDAARWRRRWPRSRRAPSSSATTCGPPRS